MSGRRRTVIGPVAHLRRRLAAATAPGGGPPMPGSPPASPWTWCDIGPDGRVRLRVPKAELGQGSHTLLAQLLADELDVAWGDVVVERPDTHHGFAPGWMSVVGGTSVEALQEPVRRAGSRLREMLREEAARSLDRAVADIGTADGHCFVRADPDRRRSYADLVAGHRGEWALPPHEPALRRPDRYRLIGRSLPRVDAVAKVTGREAFTADVRLPRMLFGAVLLPPRHAAVLARVRGLEQARGRPGVAAVLVAPDGGSICAAAHRRSWAEAALAALDVEWRGGSRLDDEDLATQVTVPPGGGHIVLDHGRRTPAADLPADVHAQYRTAAVVPLPAEPPVALVDVTPDRVVVHSATQNPGLVRRAVARALRRRPRDVRVIVPAVGGSFGRKHGFLADPAADAARLSRATGRPVQLAWTRDQDLAHGPKRPPTHHVLEGRLRDGRLVGLEHRLASADGSGVWPGTRRLARVTGVDLMALFGLHTPYEGVERRRTRYLRSPLALRTGAFRALGSAANMFALESFVDEAAVAAGAEPLAFRLDHLADTGLGRRVRRALRAAADHAGWDAPAGPGTGRGIACCAYQKTIVAMVAEVRVAGPGPAVELIRVTAAVEGRSVNPDITRAQTESGVMMGLSWALRERIRVAGGRVDTGGYRTLPPDHAPAVDTVLLDADHWGGGLNEATITPVAAAVANAVCAATGTRLRELPLAVATIRRTTHRPWDRS